MIQLYLRVDLILGRVGTHTQNTILGLQPDLSAWWQETGRQDRHTDTQVAVHAVLQLLGGTSSNLFPSKSRWGLDLFRLVRGLAAVLLFLSKHDHFNLLVDAGRHDSINVDSRQVDLHGVELANLDNVLGLKRNVRWHTLKPSP
mgnify:CR=1 FL=1